MKYIKCNFDTIGREDSVDIDLYADTHIGSASFDEKLLTQHIQETKDTGRYWAFLGDGIDGILPSDRRFNSRNISDWAWAAHKEHRLIQAEYERFSDLFSPIADKALFYVSGDGKHSSHEDVADCRADMCRALGIPGPYQTVYYRFAIYRTKTSSLLQDIVFHHGYFAGRTSGSKINNLERCLNYFPEAIGFFCGHGHTKVATPPQVGLIMRGEHGDSIYRRAAMTGSYLRTFSEETVGYGEVKLYPPVALGRITLKLSPHNNDPQKRIEITNL